MRVFEWLGLDSKGVPYYLHGLNLVWSTEGVERDLQVYRGVAESLAADAAYWAAIIRESSWRYSFAGCLCLLASGRHAFFDDLCYRFEAGSWVAPQIAVTIGLRHSKQACVFFEPLLDSPTFRRSPKQAMSAHRVLLRLGVQPRHDISTDAWSGFERDDAMIAEKVVQEQWDFWLSRV